MTRINHKASIFSTFATFVLDPEDMSGHIDALKQAETAETDIEIYERMTSPEDFYGEYNDFSDEQLADLAPKYDEFVKDAKESACEIIDRLADIDFDDDYGSFFEAIEDLDSAIGILVMMAQKRRNIRYRMES